MGILSPPPLPWRKLGAPYCWEERERGATEGVAGKEGWCFKLARPYCWRRRGERGATEGVAGKKGFKCKR